MLYRIFDADVFRQRLESARAERKKYEKLFLEDPTNIDKICDFLVSNTRYDVLLNLYCDSTITSLEGREI